MQQPERHTGGIKTNLSLRAQRRAWSCRVTGSHYFPPTLLVAKTAKTFLLCCCGPKVSGWPDLAHHTEHFLNPLGLPHLLIWCRVDKNNFNSTLSLHFHQIRENLHFILSRIYPGKALMAVCQVETRFRSSCPAVPLLTCRGGYSQPNLHG